ncbi:hypothetical protein KAZ82_02020, partial [Candidatus Babeliales bacterium]|nr:hypothetical protein [Candidatus Babeliales bacterium]
SMKHKMAVVAEMFELIVQVKDGLKRNILLMKMAERLQIPLEIIKKEYTVRYEQTKGLQQDKAKVGKASIVEKVDQERLEEQVIAILMNDPMLLTEKHKTLLTAAVSETSLKILEKIIQKSVMQQPVQMNDFANIVPEGEFERYRLAFFTVDSSNLKQTLQSIMLKFQKKYWKTLTAHIKIKIVQAQRAGDAQEVARLMDLFEELKIEFV